MPMFCGESEATLVENGEPVAAVSAPVLLIW